MIGPRLLLFLLFALAAQSGENIPPTHGITLTGKDLLLPRDLLAPHTVLILGFTKKSGENAKDWGKRIAPLVKDQNVAWLEMPVLASVPRLFRSVVLGTIRKDVPDAIRPLFLPIFEKEQEWKQLAGYREPDDAYVFIVNREGEVIWKTHGLFTEQHLREMREAIAR